MDVGAHRTRPPIKPRKLFINTQTRELFVSESKLIQNIIDATANTVDGDSQNASVIRAYLHSQFSLLYKMCDVNGV